MQCNRIEFFVPVYLLIICNRGSWNGLFKYKMLNHGTINHFVPFFVFHQYTHECEHTFLCLEAEGRDHFFVVVAGGKRNFLGQQNNFVHFLGAARWQKRLFEACNFSQGTDIAIRKGESHRAPLTKFLYIQLPEYQEAPG